eukprot:5151110-Amphidinium_carterae.1
MRVGVRILLGLRMACSCFLLTVASLDHEGLMIDRDLSQLESRHYLHYDRALVALLELQALRHEMSRSSFRRTSVP